MDERGIARQRLLSHGLAGNPFTSVPEVVAWLGAVQSQEYAVAKWSIGQRAVGVSDADVDTALADGTIVRTHVLRPTWHFVAAADVRWMLALTADRVHAANSSYYRRHGLDDTTFANGHRLLTEVLTGGRQLTRAKLSCAFAQGGIPLDGLAMGLMLMHAELEQVIVSGGLSGRQRTYALFAERVPPAPPMARDDALAALAQRYFTSRGPATMDDFQWWSGLKVADARRAVGLVEAQLTRRTIGEQEYWQSAGPPPGRAGTTPTAHLLQAYEEFIVAYRGSRGALDVAGMRAADLAGRQAFLHGVVLDGQYLGNWRRKVGTRRMSIEMQLLRPVTGTERDALADAVERYARFVGRPATWTVAGGPGA